MRAHLLAEFVLLPGLAAVAGFCTLPSVARADGRGEQQRRALAATLAGPMGWAQVEDLSAQGRLDEAVSLASRLLVQTPRDARGLRLRGLAYFLKNDCDLAEPDFSGALALDAGSAEIHAWRGMAWRCKGDLSRALADLDTAIARGVHSVQVAMYFEGQKAPRTLNVHVERAQLHRQLGNAELALADLDRVIEMEPAVSFHYDARSDLRLELGRFEEAMADARTSAGLAPTFPMAFNAMGLVRLWEGDYEEALRHFARAIELAYKHDETLRPEDRYLHSHRSLALWLSGRRAEAVSEARKALGASQAGIDAVTYMHLAFFEHEQGHPSGARSYFARAKELNPAILEQRQGRERLYGRHPGNRDFFDAVVATARQYLQGAATLPAAAAAPSVEIAALTLEPAEPDAGAAFDIRLRYRLSDPTTRATSLRATARFEIADGARALFRSEPVALDCRNGEECAWVQHMNASRQPGRFTLKVALELDGRSASGATELRIR